MRQGRPRAMEWNLLVLRPARRIDRHQLPGASETLLTLYLLITAPIE